MPCLAAPSTGPPKAGWPGRLWHGVLGVVSRISSAGSTKPGWQVRLLHDLLVPKGARQVRGAPEPLQPGKRRSLWPLCEERVAKIKGKRGFRFIKELGGAVRRETVSKTA